MSYKLIPRFYYTLPTFTYLGSFFKNPTHLSNELKPLFSEEKIWFTNHARTGLRVLLNSISDKKLTVGVQAYTCHTIFQAIHKAGHDIVFLDINDQLELDIDDLVRKRDLFDVLIVTHTFGFPVDIDLVRETVGESKIIIEDCAHSFYSKYKGKYTGTIGDAAIFSFGLGKFPPIGTGGMFIVNKLSKFPLIRSEYQLLPKESAISSVKSFVKIILYSILMKSPLYGVFTYNLGKKLDKRFDFVNKFSFKESTCACWVEKVLFNNFGLYNAIEKFNNQNYYYLLSQLNENVKINKIVIDSNPNHYIFPILVKNRDSLIKILLSNNFEAGKHFHKSIEWAKNFGYKNGDCEKTEIMIDSIVTLPTNKTVKKGELHKMANLINAYVKA